MTQAKPEQRMDERLAALLEVERQLEVRTQQREAAARAKVEAARAELKAASQGVDAELEAISAREALADETAHQAALTELAALQRAAAQTWEGVNEATIDRLARRALARAITGADP